MKYLITIFALMSVSFSYAQNINWSSINEKQKNLAYINFGYDFSINTQVGYGHKVNAFKPLLISGDYSFSMGKTVMDDFKIRLGAQVPIYEIDNFMLSAKVYGIFRRHETSLVRMANFGSEISTSIGYYKPRWHIAGECGFDKSISTHLQHSATMKENFPAIKDGWFTSTGGHFYYGIQGSRMIGNKFEMSLRVGATNAQFKDEDALLPYYAQLGLNYRFLSN